MLGRDLTGTSFPESGFNGGWHGSSHHGDKPENVANYAKMNRYHVQNLAYFCEKLRSIPDGDGTLLDHVLIYKGSNMGNSHRHAHEKVPVILVGGIDGTFKGNRHIVFPDNTQRTSNMLLSILHLFGIEEDKVGTSTGPLAPLEMLLTVTTTEDAEVASAKPEASDARRADVASGLSRKLRRGASNARSTNETDTEVHRAVFGGDGRHGHDGGADFSSIPGKADATAGRNAQGPGQAGHFQELHCMPRDR